MQLDQFLENDHAYIISPIGLSFGTTHKKADVFFLSILGDFDSPFRSDEQIIAFPDEHLCRAGLELILPRVPTHVNIHFEFEFVCEIRRALHILSGGTIDTDATVLNCINTFLDLVGTSDFDLPDEYMIIRALADRLTFREELGEFVQARALLRNAIVWCAGAVITQLRIVSSISEFQLLIPSLCANNNKQYKRKKAGS